ncbi:hypothetical protein K2P47_04005 [Patescibacteria group bacterium]|nr:hypothetical protein [Patescibacteria group bacterium]
MKKYFKEKFKLINLFLFLVVLLTVVFVYLYVNSGNCINNCTVELKKGIINPVYSGGLWLAVILGILLLFPAQIFRKWLFYIAPPILLITLYLVQGISVYSGNPLNPTRAQMAENGMFVLAVVTTLFVLMQLYLSWKKIK